MICKLIDENQIEQFPNYIEENGIVYTNEIAREKAKASGEWFDLVVLDKPQYNEETEYLIKRYYKEGSYIYLDWVILPLYLVEDTNI